MPSPNSSPHNSSPDNATPDNATPDNAIPDNATPDNGTPSNSQLAPANTTTPATPTPTPPATTTSPGTGTPTPQGVVAAQAPPNIASQDSNSSPIGDSSIDQQKAIIGGGVAGALVLLILVIICIVKCCCRKKKKPTSYYGPPHGKGQHPPHNYGQHSQHNYGPPPPNSYGKNSRPPQPPPSNLLTVNEQTHPNMPHYGPSQQSKSRMGTPNSSWGAPPNSGGWGAGAPPHSGGWGAPPHSSGMSSNYSGGGHPLPPPSPATSIKISGGLGFFTYEELASATGGFAKDNIVGQGGFGYVYKGLLPNGKAVAVKSLKAGSGQGEREFQAEIEIINRVHHRHLVSLVGHCVAGDQRMLVYEFVSNNTLEHHLHGKGVPTMNWPTRMKIAIGSAKGLAYLHEDCNPRIIHRDIKASNVLLDDSFEAKVADFGLAKLTDATQTHVSTRVMGTFGYLAPEYAASGKLTEKSDVFSFGIVLLELISGKRPLDLTKTMDETLVEWARPLLTRALEGDGNFGELVDPALKGIYDTQELTRMAACASASVRHSGKRRPKMSQIVRILEGDASLDDLKPAGASGSGSNPYGETSEYNTMQYQADMAKFRMAIMSSGEFDSSELSSI